MTHHYTELLVLVQTDELKHHMFVKETRENHPVVRALRQMPDVLDVKVRATIGSDNAYTSFEDVDRLWKKGGTYATPQTDIWDESPGDDESPE